MAKQVKIKDIAKMAGVSAGTVDRILHNRGKVSKASREAVEKVLSEVDYKYNIHTSAISLRKEYRIVISTPMPGIGEYWGSVQSGINHALKEYSDIRITCIYAYYNQFDIYSCRSAFGSIIQQSPDAVIIGPTFANETRELCILLEEKGIPYCFVDSVIEDTRPVASYTTDQYACGRILGKLLNGITPCDSELAIFSTQRVGNRKANNPLVRRKGFTDFMSGPNVSHTIKNATFSAMNPEENENNVMDFFRENRDVKGIAVMNSRGYIIADLLKKYRVTDVKLISFDLTSNNIRCLNDGSISILLCQRPELQGFQAVKSIISHLLYKQEETEIHHMMPIDIVMKENLPFYKEFISM